MHRSQGLIAIHHDCGGVRDAICRRCKPAARNAEPVGGPGTRAFASDLLRSFSHRFLFSSSQSSRGLFRIRGEIDPIPTWKPARHRCAPSSLPHVLDHNHSVATRSAPPIPAAWSSVAPLGMAGWGTLAHVLLRCLGPSRPKACLLRSGPRRMSQPTCPPRNGPGSSSCFAPDQKCPARASLLQPRGPLRTGLGSSRRQ